MTPQQKVKQLINFVAREAAKAIDPEKIILFGSYAYGNPNKDSDVDLLFIKDTDLKGIKRHSWASTSIPHLFPMDILIKTPDEVKKRLKLGDPFYKEIMQKGKVLYCAAK
ncbi:MAG: nucleotidyltransferase domain-containing protein [Candidatus Margulisbacteria bacterium]|nr:nucleotidyltransferase domain-containing protein [Candidatus Margulisiibacteriota bacterium]